MDNRTINVDPEFKSWLKTPRLDSPFLITEKIDGTNSCVLIEEILEGEECGVGWVSLRSDPATGKMYKLAAQSRNRLIDLRNDNYGFAQWVYDHAVELIRTLGVGRHYGEWWGGQIQREYGLAKNDKRFSLFDVNRYNPTDSYETLLQFQKEFVPLWADGLPELGIVPLLEWWDGDCDILTMGYIVDTTLNDLHLLGSHAVPDFKRPEGVILYHTRADQIFKKYVDPADKRAEVSKR